MLRLQEAIVSPSGDVKSSAINRLIFEHPAPMNLTILEDSPTPSTSTSSSTVTQHKNYRKSMADIFDLSDEGDEKSPPGATQPAQKKRMMSSASPCKEVTNSHRYNYTFMFIGDG